MLQAKAILSEQPPILEIPVPEGTHFTVCGDVHGQFYDLLNIFELNGLPSPENPYLFNGDFVDRGSWSVEVILTLLGFKVLYPTGAWKQREREGGGGPRAGRSCGFEESHCASSRVREDPGWLSLFSDTARSVCPALAPSPTTTQRCTCTAATTRRRR